MIHTGGGGGGDVESAKVRDELSASGVVENNSRLPRIPVFFVHRIIRNWIKFSCRQSSVDDQIVVGFLSIGYVVQLIPAVSRTHSRKIRRKRNCLND